MRSILDNFKFTGAKREGNGEMIGFSSLKVIKIGTRGRGQG